VQLTAVLFAKEFGQGLVPISTDVTSEKLARVLTALVSVKSDPVKETGVLMPGESWLGLTEVTTGVKLERKLNAFGRTVETDPICTFRSPFCALLL
jgi:hypothetical protein